MKKNIVIAALLAIIIVIVSFSYFQFNKASEVSQKVEELNNLGEAE
jgi:uncharacterized membrane protein YvbJ